MSTGTEQSGVKYQGSGAANEQFPIPFSFRHTDALKVSTISSTNIRTLKAISTHYTVIQLTTDATDVSSNNPRTEYGWVVFADGFTTTDVVHVYREEAFKQETTDFDITDSSSYINTDTLEKSVVRLTDALTTALSRDNIDPSAYSADNMRIKSMATPVRHDDLLHYSGLSLMNTTASLSIPASGGAGDNGKLLAPSSLAPSTPAVAWTPKLAVPGSSSSLQILSPVSDYANPPYIEWTSPRWITAPPNNGLSYIYTYDTGAGEGNTFDTAKSADWREHREAHPFTTASVDSLDKFVRMTSSTSSELALQPQLPIGISDDAATKRMVASVNGTIGLSPRIHLMNANQTANWDDVSSPFTASEIISNGIWNQPGESTIHPAWRGSDGWLIANALKNDYDSTVVASMVLLQPWTVAVTSTYSSATAYPIFLPYFEGEDDHTSANGANISTDSGNYIGPFRLMNFQQNIQYTSAVHNTRYLHWSGDATWNMDLIAVYESGL